MNITKRGEILEIPGEQPKVGEVAPAFSLKDLSDKEVRLESFLGKPIILSIVPDIDTRVCAIQTKRFNQEASNLSGIHFVTISNNTKEEQANWCGLEGVDMMMLHDPQNSFGEAYQLIISGLNRYARSIFVIDQEGIIRYIEIVAEMSDEPDYQKAIQAAKALV